MQRRFYDLKLSFGVNNTDSEVKLANDSSTKVI